MLENSSLAVADGVVTAQREGEWIKVQIGRSRYVKRFNLNDAEARQLVKLLAELLPD
jgi:hypothetical protein